MAAPLQGLIVVSRGRRVVRHASHVSHICHVCHVRHVRHAGHIGEIGVRWELRVADVIVERDFGHHIGHNISAVGLNARRVDLVGRGLSLVWRRLRQAVAGRVVGLCRGVDLSGGVGLHGGVDLGRGGGVPLAGIADCRGVG